MAKHDVMSKLCTTFVKVLHLVPFRRDKNHDDPDCSLREATVVVAHVVLELLHNRPKTRLECSLLRLSSGNESERHALNDLYYPYKCVSGGCVESTRQSIDATAAARGSLPFFLGTTCTKFCVSASFSSDHKHKSVLPL